MKIVKGINIVHRDRRLRIRTKPPIKKGIDVLIEDKIKLKQILKETSNHTGIKISVLKSEDRTTEIVDARYLYMNFARVYTRKSLAKIAVVVGKNHATVLYAKKRCENPYGLQNEYLSFKEHMKKYYDLTKFREEIITKS